MKVKEGRAKDAAGGPIRQLRHVIRMNISWMYASAFFADLEIDFGATVIRPMTASARSEGSLAMSGRVASLYQM